MVNAPVSGFPIFPLEVGDAGKLLHIVSDERGFSDNGSGGNLEIKGTNGLASALEFHAEVGGQVSHVAGKRNTFEAK